MSDEAVSLRVLIDRVREAREDGDSLDRVEEAVAMAGTLTEVADHLIGHFIDEARRDGVSWTQIGTRLGVTKQAVRKRFAPDDVAPEPSAKDKAFGRYTQAAQHAIVLARDSAREHHHHYIGTEHILLGVCQKRNYPGAQAIEAAGVSVDALEQAVVARLGEASAEVPEMIPFTAKAKKVLELTLRAALRLGHEQVGTEHILLGLLAEGTGLAGQILTEHGIDEARIELYLGDK
jgi:Clp amino terminal domain, pathogenicity island component